MRLSILSNVNLDMLSGLLKKENEVFQTDGYGEWITYALKKDERLAAFAPECLFLLLDGNALLEGCQDMGSVKTVLDRSEQYIEKLAENYSASYLVVSTIDVRPEHIGAGDASDLAQASGAYWDTLLTGLAERQKNIHRFELRRLIEDYGRKQFYSAKFWYMGSIPYDMKALHLLAEEMRHVMARLVRVPKKVLVLDLDNTLWGSARMDRRELCLTVHTREPSIRIPRNRSKRCSSRECFWRSRPRITARMCRVHFVRIHI